jgi:hypothetical protein
VQGVAALSGSRHASFDTPRFRGAAQDDVDGVKLLILFSVYEIFRHPEQAASAAVSKDA